MNARLLASCLAVFLILGCGRNEADNASVPPPEPASQEAPQDSQPVQHFYVYSDKAAKGNHYVPSGFMPDGQCVKLSERYDQNCFEGKTCIRITLDLKCADDHQQWAGIYWLNPANNWGRREGGYNLTGATRLTFWARGETGDEFIKEFVVGGIEGDYPDSDKVSIGPVFLSKEWKQYTIDLRGKDLSYISGGFAWSTETASNTGDACIFYLDEIRYEYGQ